MVRFNDKPQIETGSITSDDILPITDISSPEDDKKITLGQIRDFVNAGSEKANTDLVNTDMVTDSIISAPNGIFVASSSDTAITIKNGLHVVLANGRKVDTKRYNVTDYTLNADKTLSVVTLADNRYNVILSSGGSMYVVPTSDTYTTLKQPTSTSQTAYWFDQYNNYWKVTTNGGASWSNASIISLGEVSIANGKVTEVDPHPAISIPEFKIIENKAETDMSNLSEAGINRIKEITGSDESITEVQNMYETGAVSTNARALNQLKSMKHSTFDRSKFTVMGSPSITDDGIASRFSSGSGGYLRQSISNFGDKPFKVTFSFTTPSSFSGQQGIFSPQGTYYNYLMMNTAQFVIILKLEDGTQKNLYYNNLSTSTNYTGYFEWTGTTYILHLDGFDTDSTLNSTSKMTTTSATYFDLGKRPDGSGFFNGSIDLKQFSITVDDVEVFNGNKTGIDQIKKDDYEVVGVPTITDDGITSGFSSGNYLRTKSSINFSSATSWEIISPKFKTTINSNRVQYVYVRDLTGSNGGGIYTVILPNGGINIVCIDTNWSGVVYRSNTTKSINSNNWYQTKIKFTGTQYEFYYKENDDDWTSYGTVNGSAISLNASYLNIGQNANDYFIDGSIDLNSFKIYVDGNLVYQPCLKIPYTLSKTGSKIVNSVYRDRVQDVYEQFGVAQYYTLSDTDVTLPMGEIYGMFGNNFTNNPYSLLDCKWSDHEISNLSWLRSNGQWNNGNVYKSVYDLLADIQAGRKTIAGVSVKLSTATYTDYDFVINTTDKTFRLPTKTKLASGSGVVGNGMTLGFTTGSVTAGLLQGGDDYNLSKAYYGQTLPYNASTTVPSTNRLPLGQAVGITTDSSKSGIVTDSTGLYLYYYVGESVTNHAIIDVADIANQLTKYDEWVYHQDGTSGYRYNKKNGYCEQWGYENGTGSTSTSISFLKKFKDTNLNLLITRCSDYSGTDSYAVLIRSWTTSSFVINKLASSVGVQWKVSGYLAEGEY